MNYTHLEMKELPLYTHIKVDIGDPPPTRNMGNPEEFISTWW